MRSTLQTADRAIADWAADWIADALQLGCPSRSSVAMVLRASRAETIDRVLAVVAGQLITLTDVTAALDLRLQTADGAADPVRGVLTKLIDRELMLAEVDRYAPPEPTAEAVDREVQRVRARFASQEALDAALARSGIDDKHLRETLRQDLRMRAYLDQRFTAGVRSPAGAGRRLDGRPAPPRRGHRSVPGCAVIETRRVATLPAELVRAVPTVFA